MKGIEFQGFYNVKSWLYVGSFFTKAPIKAPKFGGCDAKRRFRLRPFALYNRFRRFTKLHDPLKLGK